MKKLLIISAAPLIKQSNSYSAYSPYVNELEIWAKYSQQITFCCPIWLTDRGLLNKQIDFPIERVIPLNEFSLNSVASTLRAIKSIILNFALIFKACKSAEHIHLRCPGNIGLLGCVAQIFFPSKVKSAKYAGNWDPKAVQPFSYKIQKWILSSTFLTKNINVLVYGDWPKQSKNIKSFFTATYNEADKIDIFKSEKAHYSFLFVGMLSDGKRPIYALQLIKELRESGANVTIDLYGEGPLRGAIESFIAENNLSDIANLHGNRNQNVLKTAYQNADFLILPSKSEGWPKAVAEAMFWGCVPISTDVSCVAYMLGHGQRGILLSLDLVSDSALIYDLLQNRNRYNQMSDLATKWSQKFTLDKFESEIKIILEEETLG